MQFIVSIAKLFEKGCVPLDTLIISQLSLIYTIDVYTDKQKRCR